MAIGVNKMKTIMKMLGWKQYYYDRYDFLRDLFQPINAILFITYGAVYGNLEELGAGLLQLITIPLLPFKMMFSLAATVIAKVANKNQTTEIFKLKEELVNSYEIIDTDENSETEKVVATHTISSTAKALQALNEETEDNWEPTEEDWEYVYAQNREIVYLQNEGAQIKEGIEELKLQVQTLEANLKKSIISDNEESEYKLTQEEVSALNECVSIAEQLNEKNYDHEIRLQKLEEETDSYEEEDIRSKFTYLNSKYLAISYDENATYIDINTITAIRAGFLSTEDNLLMQLNNKKDVTNHPFDSFLNRF